MKAAAPKVGRCAIYTRKSTEHNLDLEFNSLDAQRESCEAYIKSQAHEGWRLIRERYDDGGASGASLDRPALQQLLEEVRVRKVDIVVVYKVDRLTRSLADFAKLVELFDAHGVSFVSVTQSFNTTTSMGRLTLNVLLSFAQFEREVIGERVRDKIAASKRKGMWVGGPVPFGYEVRDKKPIIVPEDAKVVRFIFARYLEVGSVAALAEDLDRQGMRTKRRVLSTGRVKGGVRFAVGPLNYMLRNPFYIGEVVYRQEAFPADHEPLIKRDLFDRVQEKLAAARVERRHRANRSPALLAGRIFDDRGNPMTPTHSSKKGVRYRYYVSQALLQGRKQEAGTVARVAASDIEGLVLQNLRERFQPKETDATVVDQRLRRIVIHPQKIELEIKSAGTQSERNGAERSIGQAAKLTVNWTAPTSVAHKGLVAGTRAMQIVPVIAAEALLPAAANARVWIGDFVSGRAKSFGELSRREGKVERHVQQLARLAFLCPRLLMGAAQQSGGDTNVAKIAQRLEWSWHAQIQPSRR